MVEAEGRPLAGTFETIENPRAWLLRVAHDLAVDQWRRHRPTLLAEVPEVIRHAGEELQVPVRTHGHLDR